MNRAAPPASVVPGPCWRGATQSSKKGFPKSANGDSKDSHRWNDSEHLATQLKGKAVGSPALPNSEPESRFRALDRPKAAKHRKGLDRVRLAGKTGSEVPPLQTDPT